MDYTKIINALKDDGHTVDESTFSEKMKDPKFVEKVRSALSDIGHNVSDSSTFSKKYQNTPTLSPVDLQATHQVESTPSTVPSNRELLTQGYNALKSVPAGLLATGYGIGTELGDVASKDDLDFGGLQDAIDQGKRVYDIAMGAPTEHTVLQTGSKILTDPINLGLATITGGGSLLPQLLKSTPVIRSAIGNGLLQGVGSAGTAYLSDPTTTPTDVAIAGGLGAGLGSVFGGGGKYVGQKLTQVADNATDFLKTIENFKNVKTLSRNLPEIAKNDGWAYGKNAINKSITKAIIDLKDKVTGVGKTAYNVAMKALDNPQDYENSMKIAQNDGLAVGKKAGEEIAKDIQKDTQNRVIVALRRSLTDRAPQFSDYISKLNTVDDLVAFSDNLKFGGKFVPDVKIPLSTLGAIVGGAHGGLGGGLLGGIAGYALPNLAKGAIDATETISPRLIPTVAKVANDVYPVVAKIAKAVPQIVSQGVTTYIPDQNRPRLQSAPQDNTRVQR